MTQGSSLDYKFIMQKLILLAGLLLGLCQCQTLRYSVFEEGDPKQLVGDVKKDADLDLDDSSDYVFSLRYFSGNYQLFNIDSATGILKTNKSIDREEICPYTNPCIVELDVTVRPVSDLMIIKLFIEILDENDHVPTFPQKKVTRSISEEIVPGITFPLPAAEDPDAGENGIQHYTIESLYGPSSNTHFGLQMSGNPDGTMDISLQVLTRLDREEQSAYSFIITANDNGNPEQSGSMTVEINILDSNDNYPVFDQPTYQVEVDENIPIGSAITTVHAYDPDAGRNGQVVYSFSDPTAALYGNVFGINDTSGVLYVTGEIDFETESIYHLTVTARDLGPNPRDAFSKVVIGVRDLNDHPPDISINTLTPSGFAEVKENEAKGAFVCHLSVVDLDQGEAGQILCQIDEMHQPLLELQEISDSFEFKVVTRITFDREELDTYHFKIICSDRGSPSITAVKDVTLHIMDKNDQDPIFPQERYYATLQENNTANAFVTEIVATDVDIGQNGQISYSLKAVNNMYDNLVRIDRISGVVTTNTIFDFEQKSNYEYIITARDHGNPSRSAVALLNITIIDMNDEAPRFNQTSYTFDIEENQPSGAIVGHVSATDRDAYPFNKVSYFIDASSQGHKEFEITESGEIYTRHSLDRERVSAYNLLVVAHNERYTNTNSKVNVRVVVSDLNDNPPHIYFPSRANKTVTVSTQAPVGYVITMINATDADSGSNGKLLFAISKGNEDGKLGIDNSTGVIYIVESATGIRHRVYSLVVKVQDGGQPPKKAETTLEVIIDESVAFVTNKPGLTNIDSIMLPLGVVVGVIILLMVIILAALIIRHRSSRHQQRIPKSHKYNCRLEANKTLINGPQMKQEDSHTYRDSGDCMKKRGGPPGGGGGGGGVLGGGGGGYGEDCSKQPTGQQQQMMIDYHHQDHCPIQGRGGGVMPFLESELHPQTKMPDIVNLSHTEVDSECSGADSGKGTSEEGDWSNSTHSSPNSDILDLQEDSNKTTTDSYRIQSNGRPSNQNYANTKNSKVAKQLYNNLSPSPTTDTDVQNARNNCISHHSYTPLTTFSSTPHCVEVQQTNLDNSSCHQQAPLWGNRTDSFGNIDNGKGQYQALRNSGSHKGNGGNICRDYISSRTSGPFEEQLIYYPVGGGDQSTEIINNTLQTGNHHLTSSKSHTQSPGNQAKTSSGTESWIGREGSIRAKQDGRRHLFGNHPFSDEPLHEDDKNLTLNGQQKSAFRAIIGRQNNTLPATKKKEVRFADKCVELNTPWNREEEMVSSVDGVSEDGASITSGSYVLDSHTVLTGDTFV